MNELLQTRLFRLLSEPSQVTNEEIENAYGCFVEQMKTVSQSEQNYSEIFRMLNITRVELVFVELFYQHEQGKNAIEFACLRKTILFLESEIELLKLQIRYSEQFRQPKRSTFKSMLSLIPKSQNLGIMGMTEILTSLRLLEGIEDEAGKNPSTIAFSDTFERAFGFKFNDIYDCQRELFKRKPCNLTRTLDAMKTALMKEYRKRKSERDKKENEKR